MSGVHQWMDLTENSAASLCYLGRSSHLVAQAEMKTMKILMPLVPLLLIGGCLSARRPEVVLPVEHEVRGGESLFTIARAYYGETKVAEGIRAIIEANPDMGGGPLPVKVVLTIPALE